MCTPSGVPINKWKAFREALSASIQYLYFLRFSIVFWLLVPFLAYKDANSGLSTVTRGIFTPGPFGQFLGSAFFTVCIGMVVLLMSRLVCLNGEDRFETPPPLWLQKTLGAKSEKWVLWTLFFFQLPGAYVIHRIHRNALQETAVADTVHAQRLEAVAILAGIALAFLFWWMIDAFYYWTYSYNNRKVPARTLLFPRSFFRLDKGQKGVTLETDTFELRGVFTPLDWLFRLIAKLGINKGYAGSNGQLWEGHRIAIIAALCYLVVYIFFFPLTSPIPQREGYYYAFAGAALLFGWLAFGFFRASTQEKFLKWALAIVSSLACLTAIWFLFFYSHRPTSLVGFPILGSVLILVTLLAFIFGSLAFWADRYRIPVFTTFIVYLFVSHSIFSSGGEHYFRAKTFDKAPFPAPAHPAEIFRNRRCTQQDSVSAPCPIIIVAATGGGLHAASWAATVLTQLEWEMQHDHALQTAHFTFHDHLLFASTVSGSSDGIAPFLREYYAQTPFESGTPPTHNKEEEASAKPYWEGRIRRAANCSSLEAVGWGLEYSDFLHIVLPWVSPSLDHDRSVALETALARNMTAKKCDPFYDDESTQEGRGVPQIDALTLAGMAEDLKRTPGLKRPEHLPAFTFNTTAAETGGRFLLANYATDPPIDDSKHLLTNDPTQIQYGVAPAESLLTAYGHSETNGAGADIDLVTAARLSATFPYISSAARIQDSFNFGADHFVDGGYFDNDGISSVIEFLSEGLREPDPKGPVPVLFIEIRDSPDLNPNESDESYNTQLRLHPKKGSPPKVVRWGLFNQLTAPLGAFWQAGHVSVTRRNRRELDLLIHDLGTKANFTHIVFDYHDPTPDPQTGRQAAQPLSWHLTPSQMDKISESMVTLAPCVGVAKDWAEASAASKALPKYRIGSDVVCNYQGLVPPPPKP
jgi:hypothetical protein